MRIRAYLPIKKLNSKFFMDKIQLLSLISKTKKLLNNYEEAINNSHIPLWWFEQDIKHYININNIKNETF